MNYSTRVAILTSVLLHGTLVIFLAYSPTLKKELKVTVDELQIALLEVEETQALPPVQNDKEKMSHLKSRAKEKPKALGLSKKKSYRKKWNRSERYKQFKNLSPSLYDNRYYSKDGRSSPSPFQGEWSDKPVMATLNSMDLTEYSENHNFFTLLRKKINQGVIYPKDLAENKIIGKIWIEILIDHKGRLLQILDKSRKQPILEAYTMVNLYQILMKSLPQRFWYSKKKVLALALHFDFSVSSIPETPALHLARSQRNRMEFVRREKVPNLLKELATDYARYFPPIIPTPAGPVVNFVQVYEMIKAWSDIDPVERKRHRLQMTKEKIQALLKRAQNRKK